MLKLKNIFKDYQAGDTTVQALKDINIEFRKNEFVSILGPSGCGKTTMLNIIGGLDRYTSGDLSISGKSTKEFRDGDWDTYRNRSIGFVFQNYNLIPHQTVLSNVELAMTLSGVSKSERRKRAIEALTKVGLGDQIKKKPTQMSGGQMQRVAIARALVNNPEILLADEPTGALDSETSVQIMEILKEIAKDRLIIMVTHNPDLAKEYSSRIIKLFDGKVVDDTNPYELSEYSTPNKDRAHKSGKAKKTKKASMSFFTALSLSLNNLMTKKTRTFMTAFAGSIGIIGIALILSLSNGIQVYIDKVQRDTLSSYPLMIESEAVDMSGLMEAMPTTSSDDIGHELDKVYSSSVMTDLMNTMMAEMKQNNLEAFKNVVEDKTTEIGKNVSAVQYGYNMTLNIFDADTEEDVTKLNPNEMFESLTGASDATSSMGSMSSMNSMGMTSFQIWQELLGNQELLDSQYEIIAGAWPSAYDEVVLIVDQNNELSDVVMYSLGLKDMDELQKIMEAAMKKESYETEDVSYTYDELLAKSYKLVLPTDYYQQDEASGTWTDMHTDAEFMKNVVNNGIDIKIAGIIRPSGDSMTASVTGGIGYTSELTEYVINATNDKDITKQQQANPDTDVFTGQPFSGNTLINATYDSNLVKLGVVDLNKPSTINLYASSFEEKEAIVDSIEAYNTKMQEDGNPEYVINYTDYVGMMMSSVSSIINVISYVLIAFVAISLVVSSIMIGIITYISVLERTKEIGILRSIGASKRDISQVFNAETLIVGFVSGLLGIGVTLLLIVPINMVIKSISGIDDVAAQLPAAGALVLILISMFLTFIGGVIPSKIAAKKDPVVALRSE